MSVTVDTHELIAAAAALESSADDVLGRVAADLVPAVAETVRDAVAAAAPARTGQLRRRVRVVDAHVSGMATTETVAVIGRVAPIIIGGSAPHPIAPRHARALRFAGPPRGFAESVRHPGTRPDPFFARGARAAGSDIDRLTERAADRSVAELAQLVEG